MTTTREPITQLSLGTPKPTDVYPAVDVTDPTQSSSGTTKKYTIQSLIDTASLQTASNIVSARAATTGQLTASYNNGSLGVGATLINNGPFSALIIDNIILSNNDRVLVKDQVDTTQNGVYVVSNIGTIATPWVLTRASDYDNHIPNQVSQGTFLMVSLGQQNQSTQWIMVTNDPIVIGISTIVFFPTNLILTALAGPGIEISGDTISVTPQLQSANTVTDGLVAHTAANTFTPRTIQGTASYIDVTNGNGVLANPAINISAIYPGQNSIITIGTISTGTWNGTIVEPVFGGSGINNGLFTCTLGGSFLSSGSITYTGAFPATFNLTAPTNITFPPSGTIQTNALTNNNILVGNVSNVATDVPMSGDVSIINTGATTVSKINSVPISLDGSFTTSGAFSVIQTYTAPTTVTFPTTGTIFSTSNPQLNALSTFNTNGIITQTAANTYTGRSIQGTINKISVSNGDGVSGNPTLDISSTYSGQNSITTLGTITTGEWNGTIVSPTFGGTGVNNGSFTATLGGNLFSTSTISVTGAFSTAGAFSTSGNFSTSGAFSVIQTYTGPTNVTFPTSGTLATTSGTVASVTGTTNRITVGGTSTNPTVDIASTYVGQNSITTLGTIGTGSWDATPISVLKGGTNLTATPTNGQLPIGNGTGYTLANITPGTRQTITNSSGSITINSNLATGYIYNCIISFLSTTSVSLSNGICRDSTDALDMVVTAKTVNFATNGVNGLDTGVQTLSSWYAIFVIGDNTGVNAPASLASLSATTPTLPSGYTNFRRVGWVRTSSANAIQGFIVSGLFSSRIYTWDTAIANTTVLSAGSTANVFASLSLSSSIPSTSTSAVINAEFENNGAGTAATDSFYFRPTGSLVTLATTSNRYGPGFAIAAGNFMRTSCQIRTNSAQSLDYATTAANDSITLSVFQFVDGI